MRMQVDNVPSRQMDVRVDRIAAACAGIAAANIIHTAGTQIARKQFRESPFPTDVLIALSQSKWKQVMVRWSGSVDTNRQVTASLPGLALQAPAHARARSADRRTRRTQLSKFAVGDRESACRARLRAHAGTGRRAEARVVRVAGAGTK